VVHREEKAILDELAKREKGDAFAALSAGFAQLFFRPFTDGSPRSALSGNT